MKRENFNYLVVGIFVMMLMGLMMYVMYLLSVPRQDTAKYYVSYGNITGIKIGSPVSYGGYQVGEVTKIERIHKEGATTFKIEISIKENYKIPAKSIARIVMPNLISTQQIDITEVKSKHYLKPKGELQGEEEVSFMKLLDDVAREVTSLSTTSIKPLLHNLNRHIDKIGVKLTEQIPKIAEQTNKLLINLNQGADKFNRILGPENQKLIRNILVKADKMSSRMLNMSKQLDKVGGKITQAVDAANKILKDNRQDVRLTVLALRRSLEAVQRRINSIVYNVEQTSRNFSEFSNKIRQNPGVLIGGKSPKEKGVYRR